ncbi:MAG: hypothetical protein E3J56_10550 [Candidatus Aminicenantes bacterium]|nr:MAG: hypothetical protein E3J56_10550 [Candidatus Aminicenantes bacterium]
MPTTVGDRLFISLVFSVTIHFL